MNNGNNVILEQEAENMDDESYYISQSPIRKGKQNKPKLSKDNSNFGVENAGNQ